QLACDLGFAHAGRPGKKEGAYGLVGTSQARARHFDGGGKGFDGGILAKNHGFKIAIECGQLAAVVVGDALWRYAGDLGNRRLDFSLAYDFLLTRARQQTLRGASLVD